MQVGEWEKRPGQEELSQAMAGAEAVLESAIKEMTENITTEVGAVGLLVVDGVVGRVRGSSSLADVNTCVLRTRQEEAKGILVEAARTRAVEPGKVLRAIAFLEKVRF